MKITQVKTYALRYPVEVPFANSRMWNKARNACVVEIETDAGIRGWGEATRMISRGALEAQVIGRDPFDRERIWNGLNAFGWGDIAAISAVDIALWDIVGKALGLPVYKLLGGAYRDKIPAYASGLFRKDVADNTGALQDEARAYVDAGFGVVKMKIGFGAACDVEIVRAVREAIGPDILLAVDANCAYDVGTALDVGYRIADWELYWYEEPVAPDEIKGYREIRQKLPMRIAGGEQLEGRWAFRDPLQKRCLDIVQPDICIAGGFSECLKVQAMASANRVRVLPHMWGTAIRLAATLHWQATIPDYPEGMAPEPSLLEFDMTENGLRTELAQEPIRTIDGFVAVPQGPGLGIEIDRAVLERYAL
ncbi:MAG: mandelate racemase/muconate lactonizing enzyme family protein [Candidatus Latescibacterota bacterium]|nr:mandelate racemase/muconate lactonizing enzyme family protein [Candidatus Latescibacterota bacterium]